jgi:Icc-related predicted phosphoesterase
VIIIALADIHADLTHLPQIAEHLSTADLVLLAGDITNFGDWRQTERIISEIRSYNRHILAVPGNCDRPDVNDYLESENISLDHNCIAAAGVSFIGLGGSLPCHGSTPNEMLDNNFTNSLTALEELVPADNKFVLVTHEPAVNTTIDLSDGKHIGSAAIRRFIEKTQPLLAVSGHTHQSPGTDRIGRTTLVNPGPLKDARYAIIELTEKVKSAKTIKIKN